MKCTVEHGPCECALRTLCTTSYKRVPNAMRGSVYYFHEAPKEVFKYGCVHGRVWSIHQQDDLNFEVLVTSTSFLVHLTGDPKQ